MSFSIWDAVIAGLMAPPTAPVDEKHTEEKPKEEKPKAQEAKSEPELHCHPEFIKQSVQAWMRAGIGLRPQEAGFEVRGSAVAPTFIPAKWSNEIRRLKFQIQENTVAVFHTHPNDSVEYPWGPDLTMRRPFSQTLVPVYVGSSRGLYVTDPTTNEGYRRLREGLDWLKPCP